MKASITVGSIIAAAALSSGITFVATHGAHESIQVAVGDTIAPRFSIRTDSILKVAGTSIVANRCGSSFIFLRTWKGVGQLSADTVAVDVVCTPSLSTVASITVCLHPDSVAFAKYKVNADTGIDPALVPCLDPTSIQQTIYKRIPKWNIPPQRVANLSTWP